jgi:hypothetical protein
MSIELSTIVKQSGDQLSCKLDEEVALLNLKTTLYFGVDEVGTFIWDQLAKPVSIEEICEAVSAKYDVDRPRCQVDVIAFVQKLDEAGLVETSEQR